MQFADPLHGVDAVTVSMREPEVVPRTRYSSIYQAGLGASDMEVFSFRDLLCAGRRRLDPRENDGGGARLTFSLPRAVAHGDKT